MKTVMERNEIFVPDPNVIESKANIMKATDNLKSNPAGESKKKMQLLIDLNRSYKIR